MKDLSIEYAHIYTNNSIGKEHELSLDILSKVKSEANSKNQSFSLVILVDDYSFPDPTFNYDEFSSWLSEKELKPDLIFRESQLIPVCDEVLKHVKNVKLYNQMIDYIKTKKYPCSLFIAAWYLLRLGYLKYPTFDESLISKNIISILPESFKPFEDKGLEIMASTDFTDSGKLVSHHYIEGRLLA